MPGQPLHEATRRVVLKGADGVAFVADSARDQMDANNDSYGDLLRNLKAVGLDTDQLPVVVQYNKRDLEDAVTDEEIEALGKRDGPPIFRASAITGDGVFETFYGLLEQTWTALNDDLRLEEGFGLTRDEFVKALHDHVGSP